MTVADVSVANDDTTRATYTRRSDNGARKFLEPYTVTNENLDASILNTDFVEGTRPFSQIELAKTRKYGFVQLGLSTDVYAHHPECGHAYFVRMNGKKYKDIQESKDRNSGNCSVCWKTRQTPRKLLGNVDWLVEEYSKVFAYQTRDNARLTPYMCWVEGVFNTWLNRENFERRAPTRSHRRGTTRGEDDGGSGWGQYRVR